MQCSAHRRIDTRKNSAVKDICAEHAQKYMPEHNAERKREKKKDKQTTKQARSEQQNNNVQDVR